MDTVRSPAGRSANRLPWPPKPRAPDILFPAVHRLLAAGGRTARIAHRLGLQGQIRIERHRVDIAEWREGPPVRVVFASDFHAGPWTDPAHLVEAVDTIAAARPDLLLLGGDFVSVSSDYLGTLPEALGAVPAPLGRFTVLGNHDWISSPETIVEALDRAGIRVLFNEAVDVDPDGRPLSICGLDDELEGRPDPDATLRDAGPVRILLTHSPTGAIRAASHRFRLALAGHVHGGQIALPGGIALVVPKGHGARRYAHGRFELGPDRTLIVGRGIGCSGVPLRLFAHPEVTVVELHPRSGSGAQSSSTPDTDA